jgi:hypothetical protein
MMPPHGAGDSNSQEDALRSHMRVMGGGGEPGVSLAAHHSLMVSQRRVATMVDDVNAAKIGRSLYGKKKGIRRRQCRFAYPRSTRYRGDRLSGRRQ